VFFDTHAHYDDEQFDSDRDALLSSLSKKGVSLILNPGSNMESSEKAMALSDKYPFLYCAVGVHPHDAKDMEDGDIS
jgi:TatD DNase family protein